MKAQYLNGELHGKLISYTTQGGIGVDKEYSNGKKSGYHIVYYVNGNIAEKAFYKDDYYEGDYFYYFDNGKTKVEAKMSDGHILVRTSYFTNGVVQSETLKNNESGNYEWKYYHPNTQIASVGIKKSWPQDAKANEWIYYHTNGELYKTELYNKYGSLKDVINCYDGQGNSLDKGTFINGNGNLNEYDVNGKLIRTDIYKDGAIVKD